MTRHLVESICQACIDVYRESNLPAIHISLLLLKYLQGRKGRYLSMFYKQFLGLRISWLAENQGIST